MTKLIGGGQKRAILLLVEKRDWQGKFYSPESAIGIVSRQLARSSSRHNHKSLPGTRRPLMSAADEARRLKVSSRLLAGVRL